MAPMAYASHGTVVVDDERVGRDEYLTVIAKPSDTIDVDETIKLFVIRDASQDYDYEVTFYSLTPSVASVSGNFIYGLSPGTAKILYKYQNLDLLWIPPFFGTFYIYVE